MGNYVKALAHWKTTTADTWIEFKIHFKKDYTQMLQEGTTNTMSSKGHGTSFQAIDDDVSTMSSITEDLTSYAKKAIDNGE